MSEIEEVMEMLTRPRFDWLHLPESCRHCYKCTSRDAT